MKTLSLFVFSATLSMTAFADATNVDGLWRTETGAEIRISDCGNGTPCGVIAKLAPGAPEGAKDSKNPEKSLRARPIKGIRMLSGFEASGNGWKKGKVYDPVSGRSFRASLMPLEDGSLKLEGCYGPFCREQIWVSVE